MRYFDAIWKTFGRLVDSWCATVRWRVGIWEIAEYNLEGVLDELFYNFLETFGRLAGISRKTC